MGTQKMKMSDWLTQASKFPTHEDAERYRLANNIEIEDTGELPPVAQQQPAGGLSQANPPQASAPQTSTLEYGNLDFTKLRDDPNAFFKVILDAQRAADERAAQSSAQLYEEGRRRIMEKYAGPSQSERLFALSRAMLSPRKVPGFKGFLGNVVGALGENATAMQQAQRAREEQLFALQQQYQQAQLQRDAARPKTAQELAEMYLSATKPAAKSTASPITVGPDLKPRSRETGSIINEPPQDVIYALQEYLRNPANTPENKMITRRNFDRKYGYGASNIYGGE